MFKLDFNKKHMKQIDYSIIFLCSILAIVYGCINIYFSGKYGSTYAQLQLIWYLVGLIVLVVILLINYVTIIRYAPLLYWSSIALLIYNDMFSKAVNGASGWIKLGSRALQPAEFAKLTLIVMLAKKLTDMEGKVNDIKNLTILGFYSIVPMILILIQPDMGMTMVCAFTVLGILFLSGLNLKVLLGGVSTVLITTMILWDSGKIPVYMKNRIAVLLNPESDSLDKGYQAIQSLIGIGSGGIWGNAMNHSIQMGYVPNNVPEAHTDFIFAVIGERWGFAGAILLIIIYFVLIARLIKIGKDSKDIGGTVICSGIASTFLFLVIQNIGMNIGIMPITGVTLPFVSYGGSSMITSFIAVGLVLNVGIRSKKTFF